MLVVLVLAAGVAAVLLLGSLITAPASGPSECAPKGTAQVVCEQLVLVSSPTSWLNRTLRATLPAGFYTFTVAVRASENVSVEGQLQNGSFPFGCLASSAYCHELPARNWTYTEPYDGTASELSVSIAWESAGAGSANVTMYAG